MKRYRWSFARLFPRRWARACALGLAVVAGRWMSPSMVSAQEPLTQQTAAQFINQPIATPQENSQTQSSIAHYPYASDPLAPTWADPVCRVPNFFGDFFGTGLGATDGGHSPTRERVSKGEASIPSLLPSWSRGRVDRSI